MTTRRCPLRLQKLEDRTTPSAFKVGPELRVNTYSTSDQSVAATAMDSDGDFVVVWQSYMQDGSSHGIYARLYEADGTPTTGEFLVNTITTSFQTSPAVAMDSDGDFVIVWISGATSAVKGQRYFSAGTPNGTEFTINTSGIGTTPEVAMGAAGNFVVVWGSSTSTNGIAYRRYDLAGAPIDVTQLAAATVATGPTTQPIDVAADAAGNFVVAWPGQEFGMNPGIYVRRFPATGLPGSPEFRVNSMTTQAIASPSVAMDSDGDYVVAWQYNNIESGSIFARKYSSTDVPLAGEFKVNAFTTFAQLYPSVAIEADGDFAVTWSDSQQEGNGYGVYARCYTSAASPIGTEFLVNTTTTLNQRESVIAMDADGDFVIAWDSNIGDGTSLNIDAQRFSKVARVDGLKINDGTVQRSRVTTMAVTFNTVVTIDAGAFTLSRQGGGPVGSISVGTMTVAGRTIATLTFSGAETEFGSLVDGRYMLTIDDAAVSDPLGGDLDGDGDGTPGGDYLLIGTPANGLFRLFGDGDGNGTVNTIDFTAFRLAFGGSSTIFDFDSTGGVGTVDFNQFRTRFGSSV